MYSVSPEIWNVLFLLSRWLFVILAVVILVSALGWLASDRRARKERLRALPGAGTVGELVVLSGSDRLPAQTWFPVRSAPAIWSFRGPESTPAIWISAGRTASACSCIPAAAVKSWWTAYRWTAVQMLPPGP